MDSKYPNIEVVGGVSYYKASKAEATLRDGTKFTVATWGESVATRLPIVDFVSYVSLDLDNPQMLLIPWREFHDIGDCDVGLAEPSGTVYMLTPERPTVAQLAQMKAASIDLNAKGGLAKLKKALKKAKTSMVYAALETSSGRKAMRVA